MIAAGHASAHSIGPGVYEAHASSFVVPTHNLGYKQEVQRTNPRPKLHNSSRSGMEKTGLERRKLSQKEMWKAMKQGPSLPS
jgi:hypothetical protein